MTTTLETQTGQRPELRLVIAPLLDGTAHHAIADHRMGDGIMAAFDPARISRADAIVCLSALYEAELVDVTRPRAAAQAPERGQDSTAGKPFFTAELAPDPDGTDGPAVFLNVDDSLDLDTPERTRAAAAQARAMADRLLVLARQQEHGDGPAPCSICGRADDDYGTPDPRLPLAGLCPACRVAPERPRNQSEALIADMHRGALVQAAADAVPGGMCPGVRQLHVEDAHRLALVRAECEVQGRSLPEGLRDLAVFAVRLTFEYSDSPAEDAALLSAVVRGEGEDAVAEQAARIDRQLADLADGQSPEIVRFYDLARETVCKSHDPKGALDRIVELMAGVREETEA